MRATLSPKRLWPLLLVSVVAGCNGGATSNPVTIGGASGGGTTPTPAPDPNGIDNTGLPPGTSNPTPSSSIVRLEPTEGGAPGDGFATSVSYDAAADTFSVDNLAFDGNNVYTRDAQVPGNNAVFPYAVYENAPAVTDPVSGAPINQLGHKSIYAVSASGQSQFAIVRTGAYVDYGFGGFIYQRNSSVNMPTTGQAKFSGDYMALRDFENSGGIEYAVADMTIDIDFEDFNTGNAVKGGLRNRKVYDVAGNDITQSVIDAINSKNSTNITELPFLLIDITNNSVNANGEIVGDMTSVVANASGALDVFEDGKYYAVLSGGDAAAGTFANEVVGVIVVTSDDPRFTGVTVRETGGFILTR